MSERRRVFSGSPYEARFGYCRAVRIDNRVLVAGTAPIWPDGSCDPDAGAQARRCYEIIIQALAELGADPRHVVRTRVYITDASHTEAVGSAHGELFAESPPVNTMVEVGGLVDERWKVEIEAEAVLD
ncbi:MAG: RidA family protein [Actinomycetota bacterium]|nr:RidA family protein [Actinomycetota bacterium]